MKITFVGTSAAIPQKNRYCACTMLEVGGAIYFLDAGAPLLDELVRMDKDIHDVRAIFASHCHYDHICCIGSIVAPLTWFYTDASVSVYMPEQKVIDAYKQFLSCTGDKLDESRIKFFLTDKDFVYQDENIKLSLIPTAHMNPSFAFLIEAEGKKILLTGDLSKDLAKDDIPSIAFEEDIDVFVCEMAHFNLEQIRPYLNKCRAKHVCFHHIDPAEKRDDIKAAKGDFAFDLRAVDDGDQLEL